MVLSCVTTHNLKCLFLYDPDCYGEGEATNLILHIKFQLTLLVTPFLERLTCKPSIYLGSIY